MKRFTTAALLFFAAACLAGVNRDYCRVTGGGTGVEYAPAMLAPLLSPPTAEQYLAAGWLRNAIQGASASNGYHVASVRYEARDGRIYAVYAYAADPAPVHTYSKLAIIVAAKSAGKWDGLKAWIAAAGYTDEWGAAQNLADDYPAFATATNAIVTAGVATDAEVKAILEAARDE